MRHSTYRRGRLVALALGLSILGIPGGITAQDREKDEEDYQPARAEHEHPVHEDVAHEYADAAVPLYGNLGAYHHSITTAAPTAQRYFDQGLRLQFAFNHAEAIRSYEEALRHDPACAMCWWGIALAYGPNINVPMDEEGGRAAWEAIGKARKLASEGTASERERAYIEALAARYGADPLGDRAKRDSAYARAMKELAEAYPDDADALTLYAASLMNLSPWDYWTGYYDAREPRPGTREILTALERALELSPDSPGACHYYIHAVEAAFPKKAEPCADRLASLMPGAGHLVHMPGHIYVRVGRYADAVRANDHAVHADETYIADQSPMGVYPLAYYPHNYHFMNFAATLAGMREKAIESARTVAPLVSPEVAAAVAFIQNVLVLPQLTLLNFGQWEDVLAEPAPPELPNAMALYHYARGTAYAATGRTAEARRELEAIGALEREHAVAVGPRDPGVVIVMARHALEGEIALRGGEPDEAAALFRIMAELEDGMLYEEPPIWFYPVRHSLGRALIEAGRPAEAETAYRQDLARFPDNGWSLYGLAEALSVQGKADEAREVRAKLERAWKEADVELVASRF